MISLIDYLIGNNFIYFEKMAGNTPSNITDIQIGTPIPNLISSTMQEKLYQWNKGSFFPFGDNLQELIGNNYITREELIYREEQRKSKHNMLISIFSMSFAFLSAIGGLASPIVSCKIHKDKINHKNEQISMEINDLEYSIKEIEKNIDIYTNNDALLYNKINNLDKVYPNQVNVDLKIKEY